MIYDIILPGLPFLVGYLITYSLYRLKVIRKAIHVNLWNFVLLLAFIISGGAGFILLILLELGVVLPISQPLLYWHVEVGVTLVVVTIFHLYTYWRPSRTLFKSAKRRSQV